MLYACCQQDHEQEPYVGILERELATSTATSWELQQLSILQQSAHDLHVLNWIDSDDDVYTYGADGMSAPLNSGFSHSTETPSNRPVDRTHGEHPQCMLEQYSFVLNLLNFEMCVNTCGESQKERIAACALTCHYRAKQSILVLGKYI